MTGLHDITPGELRDMLRNHAAVITPGETLVLQVPPTWSPTWVRELQDALSAICADPVSGYGFRVLVVPGTAITIARMPNDPFTDTTT